MKKVFLLLLILPFFFACKDDASSSSEPETKPTPVVLANCGNGVRDEGETVDNCPSDCRQSCGDHITEGSEICDGQPGCNNSCDGYNYMPEGADCTGNRICAPGLACSSDGKCERQKKAIDAACASNEECISGNCSEGKCSSN